MSRSILVYRDKTGREPFIQWLYSLRDASVRRRILTRLRRLEQGHYGDCRHLREGLLELRLFFSPGYRIYFGEDGNMRVVLLCGGDKSSQVQDIQTAIRHWKEYKSHA